MATVGSRASSSSTTPTTTSTSPTSSSSRDADGAMARLGTTAQGRPRASAVADSVRMRPLSGRSSRVGRRVHRPARRGERRAVRRPQPRWQRRRRPAAVVAENRRRARRGVGCRRTTHLHGPGARRGRRRRRRHRRTSRSPASTPSSRPTPGSALVVLVADCGPVLLADPERGLVGVAHAGRPGLGNGVVAARSTAMPTSAPVAGIGARVGPSICGRCYEVPAELQDEVAAVVPARARRPRPGHLASTSRGSRRAAARGRRRCGRRSSGGCTYEDRTLYSYRRDGLTGRLAGVVWLART